MRKIDLQKCARSRRLRLPVWLLFCCFLTVVQSASAAAIQPERAGNESTGEGSWQVVPLPRDVQLHPAERPFEVSRRTTVSYPANDTLLARHAQLLSDHIRTLTGIPIQLSSRNERRSTFHVQAPKPGKNRIVLALDSTVSHPEGYRIEASHGGMLVAAATDEGIFRAIQTITKALPNKVTKYQGNKITEYHPYYNKVLLPAATITDAPRFAYRGFLIDVSRHFFPTDYLKKLLDIMALHGINHFHWHLTDDQGWRLEIKQYPRLQAVGQHRRQTISAPGSDAFDGQPVSGFYTQDEARDIVRYARERYITVVPEIDLPGHSLAALASYPQLGCTGGPYAVECRFGVFPDVLCGGSDDALQFARSVIGEVMDVFPSAWIHIGGDECPKTRWQQCSRCQQKIRSLGLADRPGHTAEDQLQAWFMGQLERDIAARGRRMMAWDEILDGAPSASSAVMAWTSPEARLRAAREGHPTIVCPITNFYFSNPHWNRLSGRPAISRVYDMEPTSPQLTAAENARIIGAEGCIWTEWVADSAKLEWQLLPRLAALAEVQWTQPQLKDFDDFMRRLPRLVNLYEQNGWGYRRDILSE